MEKTLFRFIWKYSKREQIVIILITIVSFPILYYSLEIPKLIVNEAIDGTQFPRNYLGFELQQVPYLLALCFAFLAMVILNNLIKYVLNVFKGITGERMLRRLRYELFERLMRFRQSRFRSMSSGEVIPIITSESEPLGGFVGEAVATPAYWGGTLIVYLVFIFMQDPLLGAAAIFFYPIQAVIIPQLQKRVVRLNRLRAKNIRALGSDIGESVTAINDVHAGGGSRWHLLTVSEKLFQNFRIRYEVYKRKFLIKFINNFINQLTPFFFYSIGGYMVIKGQISLGALVAVLAAYKDLAGPWKELLNHYQIMSDVIVRYETVIDNFDHDEMSERDRLIPEQDDGSKLAAPLRAERISLPAETGSRAVTGFSCTIDAGETVALLGDERSGRSAILRAFAGLNEPDSGTITLGGQDLQKVAEPVLARSIGYLNQTPHVFSGTLRGNLLYGLGIVEPADLQTGSVGDQTDRSKRTEAKITASAHPANMGLRFLENQELEDLEERALKVLGCLDLAGDVYQMGLNQPLGADLNEEFTQRILSVRHDIISTIKNDRKLSDLVHLWEENAFNPSATLGENLFFALPAEPGESFAVVAARKDALAALDAAGVLEDLVQLGATIALATIELFRDVSGDNSLLTSYAFFPLEEFDEYDAIAKRAQSLGAKKLRPANQSKLLTLSLIFSPLRHRIVSVEPDLQDRLVAARTTLRPLVDAIPDLVGIELDAILPALSISGNLLFGRRRPDRSGNREQVNRIIRDAAEKSGLRQDIERVGLTFDVGTSGGNLSAAQKLRVGVARSLISKPNLVVFDGLLSSGSSDDKVLLDQIREIVPEATFVIGVSDQDYAQSLGRVIEV